MLHTIALALCLPMKVVPIENRRLQSRVLTDSIFDTIPHGLSKNSSLLKNRMVTQSRPAHGPGEMEGGCARGQLRGHYNRQRERQRWVEIARHRLV